MKRRARARAFLLRESTARRYTPRASVVAIVSLRATMHHSSDPEFVGRGHH